MKLVFGLEADSRVYPDFPGSGPGVLDEEVVGPRGLVGLLEIQLGLSGPTKSEAVRIAAYAAKLQVALAERKTAFFAASFSRDPWATAERLLHWRDNLVLAGWAGTAIGTPRADDLAAAEKAGNPLPSGFADRLVAVQHALATKPTLRLSEIGVIELPSSLPPHINELFKALTDCGVTLNQRPVGQVAATGNDLAKVSKFLKEAAIDPLVGDGSFMVVQADTALMAAEAVAEWLAAGTEADLNDTVVLAPDGDTALLDGALLARGLPALGQSASSPWRGALQVLPLAFATIWKPFNPKPLLDLLLLPKPPIGFGAARTLAYALSKEPGIGGKAWKTAWERIEARQVEKEAAKGHADAETRAAKKLKRWQQWTTVGQYDRHEGIPAEAAKAIASRVSQWAFATNSTKNDPLLLSVAAAATALVDAITVIGRENLPALLIERMIEQVLAEGAENPNHIAQSGGLRCIRHPAALWGTAKRVIWWNFTGPGERVRPPSEPWSKDELEALEKAGCMLASSADIARQVSAAYVNAVFRTSDCLLLVRPSLSGSDETTSHPLAHQLMPILKASEHREIWQAEQLLASAATKLANRNLARQLSPPASLPKSRKAWTLPAAAVAKVKGREESPTGLENLVNCQMRWLLSNVLGLSAGRFAEIPDTDQLLGNLAHEIASQVFKPGTVPDKDKMRDDVGRIFDELVDAIAAPLNQPEHAGELIRARVHVPSSLAHLADYLRSKGLEVVGTELSRAADLGDLKIAGRLDMLVKNPEGAFGVIDLKWSHSARRRLTEITDGRAIQLAAYGTIADASTSGTADGAYYLLNQRRLIGQEGGLVSEEEVEVDKDLSQTWLDLISTWKSWRDEAIAGNAIAGGIEGAPEPPAGIAIPADEKPCKYCDYTSLCRVSTKGS